ncbi:MAG: aminotransferase class V-fold PLP-dependent enzyme, partial [Clostridia bacterium]|nr:aminotransferase class V-fold PLP-dependent enzyme [Clostridia bacterium]
GSEADNWAIFGAARKNVKKGKHLITSVIEHHAVLHCFQQLEKEGFTVTYIPVDSDGLVSVDDVKNAITPETTLISIMMANNEIGTIQPIKEIAQIAKENNIVFHTDAVQAVGHIPVNVEDLGVNLLSVSAHKFEGPKGVGFLYVKTGTWLIQLMYGGAQEKNRRAGTENVAGIVGMATALKIAVENLDANMKKCYELRERFIDGVLSKIEHCRLNGSRTERLPGNANISFEFIEGESLLLSLDLVGIAASSGSACTSGSLDPSHVLLAIGLPHAIAHGSLRASFSHRNTSEEVDKIIEELVKIVQRLRDMSPLYEDYLKGKK